ncbi:CGNR zinc finger domain-containing protein [Rathayibacter sp. YIM 133350]|uniref:CGNR zinc finger domain-containing protein n=1 Tax=Rathayibacter sp. YIM 133350 TaxID=3131992 RepID=UPI00307F87BF
MAPTMEEIEDFSRIAGDPALDLVNTVSWRLNDERRIEHLTGYRDVLRWAAQVGLLAIDERATLVRLSEADERSAASELEQVRALREAFYEAVYLDGSTESIGREYADATRVGALSAADAGWRWELPIDLALPRRRIAIAMVALLTGGGLDRLGQCADADCGWVYLDSSPRHNRRWCVAADCGNRNRVRDYYARTRASAT